MIIEQVKDEESARNYIRQEYSDIKVEIEEMDNLELICNLGMAHRHRGRLSNEAVGMTVQESSRVLGPSFNGADRVIAVFSVETLKRMRKTK